jgi:hypothetical protein
LEEIRRWKEVEEEQNKLSLPKSASLPKQRSRQEPRLSPFYPARGIVRRSFHSPKVKSTGSTESPEPEPLPKAAALPSRKMRTPPSLWFFGGVLVAAGMFAAVVTGYFLLRGLMTQPTPVAAHSAAEAKAGNEAALPVPAETPEPAAPITEIQQRIADSAMSDLRAGDAPEALAKLQGLRKENPRLPSLDYLIALAGIQAGEIEITAASIESSLAKGERVSDAYALRAALEDFRASDQGGLALGDLRARAEMYLQEAMASDLANPYPYIEMAMRLRGRGQNVEARKMLEAARSRLHPVDSYALLESTMLLIDLQGKPDHELPLDLDPDKNAASLLGAAYVALRRGEFSTAVGLLHTGRERLPPDLFAYLMGDPELRKFASRPEIATFYQ